MQCNLAVLGLALEALQAAQPANPAGSADTFQAVLQAFLHALILLANVAGGLVIGVAIVRGLVVYLLDLARERAGDVPKEGIRLSLGRSLALALEFQLGGDILGTALNPTLNDILVLASIVVLRTVLNYFLGRELREAEQREHPARQANAEAVGDTSHL